MARKPPETHSSCSTFHRATGDRNWSTNFRLPSTGRVIGYHWIVRLNGKNTFRFVPSELKIGFFDDHQDLSFEIRDCGKTPIRGDGSNVVMTLDVTMA